jgi:hypothetical protein
MNITHENIYIDPSTKASMTGNRVIHNAKECIRAFQLHTDRLTRSETVTVLAVPAMAVLTAVLPFAVPHPATRFMCAAILSIALAVFIGQKVVLLEGLSRTQLRLVKNAMMGTLLFGLVIAILCSEGIQLMMSG